MTKLKVHICMVIPKIKIQDIPETKVNYISKYTVPVSYTHLTLPTNREV